MTVKATFSDQILKNSHSSNPKNLACETGFVTDHQKAFLRALFLQLSIWIFPLYEALIPPHNVLQFTG